ncbi:MAG TPA: hypothetical protein VF980_13455 [Thermoanaerobaculia bacterium]
MSAASGGVAQADFVVTGVNSGTHTYTVSYSGVTFPVLRTFG